MKELIPFHSTHVRCVRKYFTGFTPGKTYGIVSWGQLGEGRFQFYVRDNDGDFRRIYFPDLVNSIFEDYSFLRNLEEILK